MPKSPDPAAADSNGNTITAEHNLARPHKQLSSIEIKAHTPQDVCRHETAAFSNKNADTFHPSRAMQWALLSVVTIITFVMLTLPLALAILKGQALLAIPSTGTLALGYVWMRIAQFIFPLAKREHEYRMAKLWVNCLQSCSQRWRDRQSQLREPSPPDNNHSLYGSATDELLRIKELKDPFDNDNTGSSNHKADR